MYVCVYVCRFNITPLHIATSVGHTPCMQALVQCLADINSQESWGQTPLIIATLNSRVQCMRALVHLGANTEVKDHQHHRTALHVACSVRDEETLLILLDARADVQSTDGNGHSSLGVALENKFYHAVPLLVEYGAKLKEKDRDDLSAMLEEYVDNLAGVKGQCSFVMNIYIYSCEYSHTFIRFYLYTHLYTVPPHQYTYHITNTHITSSYITIHITSCMYHITTHNTSLCT